MVCEHDRHKQLDDKVSSIWQGPWNLIGRVSRVLWRAEDDKRWYRIGHSEAPLPFVATVSQGDIFQVWTKVFLLSYFLGGNGGVSNWNEN